VNPIAPESLKEFETKLTQMGHELLMFSVYKFKSQGHRNGEAYPSVARRGLSSSFYKHVV